MPKQEKREREGEPRVIPAVRIADASDEVLQGVLNVYDEVAFGRVLEEKGGSNLHTLRRIIDDRFFTGLRFGSRLTGHSKLEVRRCRGSFQDEVISFSFYGNMGRDDRGYQEGEVMAEEFQRRAAQHLSEVGVLFTAPDIAN